MEILSQISSDFVAFVVVLTVLVFVHEFGHYLAARLNGVKVETFSIGFGPEIFGWTDKTGVRWKFSIIPLGGYLKMYGDEDVMSTRPEDIEKMEAKERQLSLHAKSVGQRSMVAAAGPMANFLLAIAIFLGVFAISGSPYLTPHVGGVVEGGAAAASGIEKNDKIIAVNGKPVTRFDQLIEITAETKGQPLVLDLERGEEAEKTTLQLTVTPQKTTDSFGNDHYRIGVQAGEKLEYESVGPFKAAGLAVKKTWDYTVMTLNGVGQIISGARSTNELGGPLRIAKMSGRAAGDGLISLLVFTAIISINLGLINLFPIPALDGGHLLFFGIEALRGRPLSEKIQGYVTGAGVLFILFLMVFSLWNDIVQLKIVEFFVDLF